VKGQVPVALSDEERRRLEKLEQELAAADPDLARELAGLTRSRATSKTLSGVLTVIGGFALIIAGIITKNTIIGVVGFLLMVGAADRTLNDILRRPKCHEAGHEPHVW
jgi:sensor domain CHASE-containing protein